MALPQTIVGRILHQPGPWGSRRPLRNVGQVFLSLSTNTQSVPFGSAYTDEGGQFTITGNLQPFPASGMYIQVVDVCQSIMHNQPIPRPPRPDSSPLSPDNLGDITVPWEPADAQLATLNTFFLKDTQTLARRLCELLRSPYYPIHITLRRESVDGTGQDYTVAQRMLIPLKVPRSRVLTRIVEDIQDEVMSTQSNKLNEAIIEILQRLAAVNIKALESS